MTREEISQDEVNMLGHFNHEEERSNASSSENEHDSDSDSHGDPDNNVISPENHVDPVNNTALTAMSMKISKLTTLISSATPNCKSLMPVWNGSRHPSNRDK